MFPVSPEILLLAPATAAFAAAATLVYRRLVPVYPALLSYLLLEVIQDLSLLSVLHKQRFYFIFWVVFQAIGCGVLTLVARELLNRLIQPRAGLALLVRRSYTTAVVVALVVSLSVAWMAYEPGIRIAAEGPAWNPTRFLIYSQVTLTVVLGGTAAVLVLSTVYLVWFAVRLPKTLAFHYFIFLFYTWGGVAGMLIEPLVKRLALGSRFTDVLLMGSTVMSFIAWATLLGRNTGTVSYVQIRHLPQQRESQLINQLDRMNQAILHTLEGMSLANRKD